MSTILLIEPHPLLRLGLCQLLHCLPTAGPIIEVDPADAPPANDMPLRDAALLIYGFPEREPKNWAALERLCARLRPRSVLILDDGAPLPEPAAMPDFVRGWVSKSSSPEALAAAIRLVLAGGECFPAPSQLNVVRDDRHGNLGAGPLAATVEPSVPSSAASVTSLASLPSIAPGVAPRGKPDADVLIETEIETPSLGAHRLNITERQYEVLVLLARGYPIKTVSRVLNISVATAKTHACTLYQRLQVRNKGEAVYEALRRGAKLNWPGPAAPAGAPPRRAPPPLLEAIEAA